MTGFENSGDTLLHPSDTLTEEGWIERREALVRERDDLQKLIDLCELAIREGQRKGMTNQE